MLPCSSIFMLNNQRVHVRKKTRLYITKHPPTGMRPGAPDTIAELSDNEVITCNYCNSHRISLYINIYINIHDHLSTSLPF